MMRGPLHPPCGHAAFPSAPPPAVVLGATIGELVAALAGLSVLAVRGGVWGARRTVERLVWGGHGCCDSCRCGVVHHYRYECRPSCSGCCGH
jgi:hypothetical protein